MINSPDRYQNGIRILIILKNENLWQIIQKRKAQMLRELASSRMNNLIRRGKEKTKILHPLLQNHPLQGRVKEE
jgi:hypothetical protein